MTIKRLLVAVGLSLLGIEFSCTKPAPVVVPPPHEIEGRDAEFEATCKTIWQTELGRTIDVDALKVCIKAARLGATGDEIRAGVHGSDEAVAYRKRQENPPLRSKRAALTLAQGNFGSIPVTECWTFSGTLFDPVDLLVNWTIDHDGCFDVLMKKHADRGDTEVRVDPRADYHEQNKLIDLWHEPDEFAKFLRDIRRHRNVNGDVIEPVVVLAGDGHIPTFLDNWQEGMPNDAEEAHAVRDYTALAAVTQALIGQTVQCWECRHQRNYVTPGGYRRLGTTIAALWPNALHWTHLIEGSSSVASWRCDPDTRVDGQRASDLPQSDARFCGQWEKEADDPFRGNEPGFWAMCRREGWCDGLRYQFHAGDTYTNPHAYPNYTGHDGAMGRYYEIIVRAGDDPQSVATAAADTHCGPGRCGWVQFPIIADEFIYDAYNKRSTEAYALDWCKQALALGGWGCGSASWRRP